MASTVNNKKFNPKELVKSKEYGFLGEPLDTPVEKTVIKNGTQRLEFSSISKRNLSLGPYQRPEDKKRIENIRENFHEDGAVINVAEISYKGKYYYTIPDGQHRAKAQPEKCCMCVITNTLPEADLFLLFNDPKCTKTTSNDDRFWASVYQGDESAIYLLDYLKDTWDIELTRNTKENIKSGKFVAAATLEGNLKRISTGVTNNHSIPYKDKETSRMKRRLTVSQDTVSQEVEEKFECLCEAMFGTFGTKVFHSDGTPGSITAYSQLWGAMRRFLTSDHCKWMDPSAVCEALSVGAFSRNGRGKKQSDPVLTIPEYIHQGKLNWPELKRVEQLFHVILSVYKHGSK